MVKGVAVKPFLVLIHGLRGDSHGLAKVAECLRADFEVLTPDLPGTGDNPELSDKTLDGYAEWLHEYCVALPMKPYIVGHSMGSIIVSYFANKYPDDTREKLVLMAPIFRDRVGKMSGEILYGVLEAVLAPLSKGAKHKVMASRTVSYVISHFLTYDKSQQREIDELHYQYAGRFASSESLLADVKISMTEAAIVPESKETLLCIGMHDRLMRADFVRVVARKEGATFREIADAGHLLNYERPDEVAWMIRDFLF